ncbi:MAG TPA: type II secretion system F family protein [Thermoanaerobaculia bacterium]|nr:type II secretion system F family protein [Thermoanaerobaculia bacterium]
MVEEIRLAQDENTLRAELDREGLHLFEARPRGLPRLALPRPGGGVKKVPVPRFLVFNQELASLLKAGLPLLQALDLMLERMKPGQFREILNDVRIRVRTGEELSEAFAAHRDAFPRLYPAALKAGEKSGELEQVLRRFVRYLKLVTDARKKVVSALIYPAVLIGLSIGMVLLLSIAVVPKFEEFFKAMNVELPLLSKLSLGFSLFLVDHLTVITITVVVAVIAFLRWRRTDHGRRVLDRAKIRVPLLGPVLHGFAISELCRSLATLLSGGIPLLTSFEISCEAVGNTYVRDRLLPTLRLVREGGSFHSALEQSGVVMPLAVDMVKVGEATGSLDEMLSNVSDFLDEEIETQLQRMLALLEPLMLVLLALIIGLILVSIYVPLFSSLSKSAI